MILIPAIDLLEGRCVRLLRGDYSQAKDYSGDPVAVAKEFAGHGATWLHLVDLDGARSGAPRHLDLLGRIARATRLSIQFGGGLRTLASARMAIEAGAARVVAGTRLTQDDAGARAFFAEFGEAAVAAIDARDGVVATHGWTASGGHDAVAFALRMQGLGCRRVAFTDVASDGALEGPNLAATRAMAAALTIPVLGSGGVASLEDLDVLAETGVEGAIVGRALYEGRFTLAEAFARL
jgi:phosphoribosylformimino-5-aminoimidazole carboxamide ribotide isomerase